MSVFWTGRLARSFLERPANVQLSVSDHTTGFQSTKVPVHSLFQTEERVSVWVGVCVSVCLRARLFRNSEFKNEQTNKRKNHHTRKTIKKNIFLKKERKEGIKKEKEEEEDDAEEIVGACRKARRQTVT